MGDVLDLGDRLAARGDLADVATGGRESTGDGSVEDPCYGCECCTKWSAALEQLHAAVLGHNERTPRAYPCSDDCLVCRVAAWSR